MFFPWFSHGNSHGIDHLQISKTAEAYALRAAKVDEFVADEVGAPLKIMKTQMSGWWFEAFLYID